jgi:hypothetical protein
MSSGVSGQLNERNHASGYFHRMVKATRMRDYFNQFNQYGPAYGYQPLTQKDLKMFEDQYKECLNKEKFYALYEEFDDDDVVEWFDFFIYWVKYALENSDAPAIVIR